MTSKRQKVSETSLVEEGQVVRILLDDGRPVALYNVAGTIYATDDRCTHGNSSLSDEGYLEGFVIECGRHGGSFDVRTGSVILAPCTVPLRTYEVEIDDGAIYLMMASE